MTDYKYKTLTEVIYQKIKKTIIKGEYKNKRLLLHDIANEMDVSITPVREALKKLEKDGLIRIIPNKGAEINDFTIKDINEIYDVREKLESLAVEMLIKKNNNNFLEPLEKLLKESERYIQNNNIDLEIYAKYCEKFHKLLVGSTDNTRLIKFYSELEGQLAIFMNRTAYIAGEPERSSLEHRKIFEALRKKNIHMANKNIKHHIKYAKKEILERSNNIDKRKIDSKLN